MILTCRETTCGCGKVFANELSFAKHLGRRPAQRQPLVPGRVRRGGKYAVAPKEQRTLDGQVYASKSEARRAVDWKQMRAMGFTIIEQPRFNLGVVENVYRADAFVVGCFSNCPLAVAQWVQISGIQCYCWVEDVKGMTTRKFARDVKLWRRYGQCPLRIMKLVRGRWHEEWVMPERKLG